MAAEVKIKLFGCSKIRVGDKRRRLLNATLPRVLLSLLAFVRLLFVRTPRSIGTLVLGNLLQDFIIDESQNLADREWIWNRYGTAYRVTGQKK